MKKKTARTPLSTHTRRMCAVIGICFLAALALHALALRTAEKWALGAGCLMGAALLIMLLTLWLRERRGHGDN